MTVQEAVLNFVNAANALREHPDIEIGFAFADLLQKTPVKTYYALHAPAKICGEQLKFRLPEEV